MDIVFHTEERVTVCVIDYVGLVIIIIISDTYLESRAAICRRAATPLPLASALVAR